ncbi:hypothetical protein ACHAQI_008528 [Fusarium lateritium]
MSDSQKTIIITNNSGQTQNYVILSEKPEASDVAGRLWYTVFETAGNVSGGQSAEIVISPENFAITGEAPLALGPGVTIVPSSSASVTLATNGEPGTEVTAENDDGEFQLSTPSNDSASPGSFTIKTGQFTNARYPNAFVGWGKSDNQGEITPLSVWNARSNQTYRVYPGDKYYVATGDFSQGEIVDVAEFGNVSDIDFTGRSTDTANITDTEDGYFTSPEWS